jgi:FAD/FMN-containing dehydrogenase
VTGALATGLASLAGSLAGSLVRPEDPEFASLRKPVLGRLTELLPRAVVRCAGPEDVAAAVGFARAHRLPFALRSGGHSFADFCTTGGLLIDLAGLDTVRVVGETATVGPGIRLGDLAERLVDDGRIAPLGWCPTVAVGGSVLGGGYGALGRYHGLGCDHLLAAQVVLADGRTCWVDQEREPELFWALRGAGCGNFGAVTALVLRTQPAPRVSTFVQRWPWRHAARVIDAWQRWAPDAPDEVNAELVLQAGDPVPEPRVTWFGTVLGGGARPLLEEFLDRVGTGDELGELSELSARVAATRHTYAGIPMSTELPAGPPLERRQLLRVVKSEFFDRPVPPEAVRALVDGFLAELAPGQYRELELVPWGGAYRRVPARATAFAHRSPRFMIGHHGLALPQVGDEGREAVRDWVRRSWEAVHPWGTGAVYPNYPDPDLAGWARAYYGANLARLIRVKARYDPDQVFRYAQSVPIRSG